MANLHENSVSLNCSVGWSSRVSVSLPKGKVSKGVVVCSIRQSHSCLSEGISPMELDTRLGSRRLISPDRD